MRRSVIDDHDVWGEKAFTVPTIDCYRYPQLDIPKLYRVWILRH